MTAPADVWAVEITPTALLCHDVNSRHPALYLSEQEASRAGEGVAWACSREGYPRVVRFRLVRADEPEQPVEPPRHTKLERVLGAAYALAGQADQLAHVVARRIGNACVRDIARVLQHCAGGVVGDLSLRSVCIEVLDRLAAPGQGGAT